MPVSSSGKDDVEYSRVERFYLPPSFLRRADGPQIEDMWSILGRGTTEGGKPSRGALKPEPFHDAGYLSWQGGSAQKALGTSEIPLIFATHDNAQDPAVAACGRYVMSQFDSPLRTGANLVDLYGGYSPSSVREQSPAVQMQIQLDSASSPDAQLGYTDFVQTKLSEVIEGFCQQADAKSLDKMESVAANENVAANLVAQPTAKVASAVTNENVAAKAKAPGLPVKAEPDTPVVISSNTNALRLPTVFEKLGHANVIMTETSGYCDHMDGPESGAIACIQGGEAWKAWKSGDYGSMSLSEAIVEFAKTHDELKGAFMTFPQDADQMYPGWREQLCRLAPQKTPEPEEEPAEATEVKPADKDKVDNVANVASMPANFTVPAVPVHKRAAEAEAELVAKNAPCLR